MVSHSNSDFFSPFLSGLSATCFLRASHIAFSLELISCYFFLFLLNTSSNKFSKKMSALDLFSGLTTGPLFFWGFHHLFFLVYFFLGLVAFLGVSSSDSEKSAGVISTSPSGGVLFVMG
jgi:hypothetical protein